jgi:hypothetical protein
MQILTEVKGYKTQETAIKAASTKINFNQHRWIMMVTPSGRFQVCLQGDNQITGETGFEAYHRSNNTVSLCM